MANLPVLSAMSGRIDAARKFSAIAKAEIASVGGGAFRRQVAAATAFVVGGALSHLEEHLLGSDAWRGIQNGVLRFGPDTNPLILERFTTTYRVSETGEREIPEQDLDIVSLVGRGAEPRKNALFLWNHGLGSNKYVDLPLLLPLMAQGFDVLSISQPGTMQSTWLHNQAGEPLRFKDVKYPESIMNVLYAALVDHTNQVAAQLGAERVFVGGHSFGAFVSTGLTSAGKIVESSRLQPKAPEEKIRGLEGMITFAGLVSDGEITGTNPYVRFLGSIAASEPYLNPLMTGPIAGLVEMLGAQLTMAYLSHGMPKEARRQVAAAVAMGQYPVNGVDRKALASRAIARGTYAHLAHRGFSEPKAQRVLQEMARAIELPNIVGVWGKDDKIINSARSAAALRDYHPHATSVIVASSRESPWWQFRPKVDHMFVPQFPELVAEIMARAALHGKIADFPTEDLGLHGLQLAIQSSDGEAILSAT